MKHGTIFEKTPAAKVDFYVVQRHDDAETGDISYQVHDHKTDTMIFVHGPQAKVMADLMCVTLNKYLNPET